MRFECVTAAGGGCRCLKGRRGEALKVRLHQPTRYGTFRSPAAPVRLRSLAEVWVRVVDSVRGVGAHVCGWMHVCGLVYLFLWMAIDTVYASTT